MFLQRIIVIVNPMARRAGRMTDDVGAACKAQGIEADFAVTAGPGDATRIAGEAASAGTHQAIVGIGGDGTMLEILTGVANQASSLPVGIVPGGTANVLARTFAVPMRTSHAIATALKAQPVAIDLGRLPDGRRFAIGVGAGLDAAMIRGASPAMKRAFGWGAYVLSAARAGLRLPRFRARLTVDGKPHELTTSSVLIANHGVVANGLVRLGGDASPSDGVLEACVYSPRHQMDASRMLWRMRRGTVCRDRCFTGFRGREFTIETDPPAPIQADGELLGVGAISAVVEPLAARLLVGKATSAQTMTEGWT